MKKLLASVALAAAVATPALAAPENFIIDNNHTFPSFSYNHFGYSVQMSRFNKVSGKILLDREAKSGDIDITIDTTSVNTGSTVFNGHIQGPDFLDTAQFPTATYKSTKLHFDGAKLASIDGNLTIKGISKPVTLSVTHFHCMPHPMLKKEACGANATAKIKRSEFNAGKYAPNVGDEVTLSITIEAIKE